MNYKKERKIWLARLKKLGVKAPAKMYPSNIHDDNKEDQIDRMKSHYIELARTTK